MVTKKQKPILHTQEKRRRESKHDKERHQTTKEGSKREKEQRASTKQPTAIKIAIV